MNNRHDNYPGSSASILASLHCSSLMKYSTLANHMNSPITRRIMQDPLIVIDRHSNERKTIETWLHTHAINPVMNTALSNSILVTNSSFQSIFTHLPTIYSASHIAHRAVTEHTRQHADIQLEGADRCAMALQKNPLNPQPVAKTNLQASSFLPTTNFDMPLSSHSTSSSIGSVEEEMLRTRREPEPSAIDADTLFIRGQRSYISGHYVEALMDLSECLRVRPNDAATLNLRGLTYDSLDREDEALGDFAESLHIRPNNAGTLNNRGLLLFRLGRYHEALEDFTGILQTDKNDADALMNRGATLKCLNCYQQALADSTKSLLLRPRHAKTLYNRGTILSALGRYDEALADFRESLAVSTELVQAQPNSAEVCSSLSYAQGAINTDFSAQVKIGQPLKSTKRRRTYG